MSKSNAKGTSGELEVARLLTSRTDAEWKRTPGSGNGNLKGDIYCEDPEYNGISVEVKFLEIDLISSTVFNPSSKLIQYWKQTISQAGKHKEPLLFFRKNHGKWHIASLIEVESETTYIRVSWSDGDFYVYRESPVVLNHLLKSKRAASYRG